MINDEIIGDEMLEEVVFFDPNGGREFPNITHVEDCLGGVGRLMFPDGTVQFAEYATYPEVVYSPRLPEVELEVFCGQHRAQYEAYFEANVEAIHLGDPLPPIERFWEK